MEILNSKLIKVWITITLYIICYSIYYNTIYYIHLYCIQACYYKTTTEPYLGFSRHSSMSKRTSCSPISIKLNNNILIRQWVPKVFNVYNEYIVFWGHDNSSNLNNIKICSLRIHWILSFFCYDFIISCYFDCLHRILGVIADTHHSSIFRVFKNDIPLGFHLKGKKNEYLKGERFRFHFIVLTQIILYRNGKNHNEQVLRFFINYAKENVNKHV